MPDPNDTATHARGNGQGRVPPHDTDAEAALLGACLLTGAAVETARATLKPDDFHDPGHRLIFAAIGELHEGGEAVDPVTVADVLRLKGKLKHIGGPATLLNLQAGTPATSNAGRYAGIVKNHADLRAAIRIADEIKAAAYGMGQAAEVATGALVAVQGLVDSTNNQLKIFNMEQLVHEHLDLLEARADGTALGLATGFRDLDDATSGLHEGELVLVVAEPGVGKSAFVGNVARRVTRAGSRVAVFSVEMARLELMDRLLAAEARVPLSVLRNGSMGEAAWKKMGAAQHQLLGADGLHIVDDPDVTLAQIDAAIRRTRADLFIVDYAQILKAPEGSGSREREVAAISSELKRIARRHRIPGIVLSAINRQVNSRADQRPTRSDIRESGQLEYDANLILGLYRDELKDPDTTSPGIMEVIVLKSRNSRADTIRLRYDPDTQLISDVFQPGSAG